MDEYDSSIDYCGPGESWLTKRIPNKIKGVSINHCCYLHDVGWRPEEPRYKDKDVKFRNCIKRKFKRKAEQADRYRDWVMLRLTGFIVSWLYYISVRIGSLHNRLSRN